MTLRSRDKAALGIVGGLIVLVALYLLVLAPLHHTAAKLTTSIASAQAALTEDQALYSSGRADKASAAARRADWAALARAVPATANVPALLRVIQREADAAGVKVQTISLSGSSGTASSTSAASATASTSTSTTAGSTASTQATAVPLSLTFVGGYQGLNRMIGRLDALVEVRRGAIRASGPLMSIGSVDLSGAGSKITAQLTATIYQLDPTTTASTGGTA